MPNEAVLIFAALNIRRGVAEGRVVIDVGAKMGAGLGPLVKRLNPKSYLTVDVRRGAGVDLVCDVTQIESTCRVGFCRLDPVH